MQPRVLIVDDDPDTVTLMCKALDLLGFESFPAHGGAQALEHIKRDPPDLVLLDLMMPEIDGYEVLRWMRSQPEMRTLPVVVVTASEAPDLQSRLAEFYVTKIVKKPVTLAGLKQTIASGHLTAAL
jgi:CheY-like chemotaxis protein